MANVSNVKVLSNNKLQGSGSSVQLTGSGASIDIGNSQVVITGTLLTNGDAQISGTLTAGRLVVNTITSASTTFSSGSTVFGDNSNDTHQFSGSVFVSGPLSASQITGSISGTVAQFGTITGSQISGTHIGNISGTLAQFTTVSGSQISGSQITGSISGTLAQFTTITGSTVTGNLAQFTTISGSQVSIGGGLSIGGDLTVNGTLNERGAVLRKRTSINSSAGNYTASISDQVIIVNFNSAADFSLRLPGATDLDGRELVIKRGNDANLAQKISVLPSGSNTIDLASSLDIWGPLEAKTLIADSGSSNWVIV